MSTTASIYISSLLFVTLCSSSFTKGSSIMPYPNNALAIGYDANNDTILLFGGDPNVAQFTTFKNHEFIGIDLFFLTYFQETDSYSQHYSQLNNQLWIIRKDGGGFIKIDTTTYNVESPSISIPINVNLGGCLTSVDNHLIVIAGRTYQELPLDTVQIYRMSDEQWISNVPSLNTARTSLSCVTVSSNVYAIGGIDSNTQYLDTIEVLDISNIDTISSASWSPFSDTLSIARDGVRADVYHTDIYVIGGRPYGATNVDIIDTTSGTVIPGDPLSVAVAYASCIIVRNTLFVFGGFDGRTYSKDIYQYLTLPTYNPSMPTNNTISTLSSDVSSNPTLVPVDYANTSSYDSTKDLTSPHTNNPTVTTTISRTEPTTQKPEPTTYDPTIDTNDVTTKYPFIEPSIHPTIDTSLSPSFAQITERKESEISSTVDVSSQETAALASRNDTALKVAVFIGIICIIFCISCFGVYYWWQSRTNNETLQNMKNDIDAQPTHEKPMNDPVCLGKLQENNVVKMVKVNPSDLLGERDDNIGDSSDDDLLEAVNVTIELIADDAVEVSTDASDDVVEGWDTIAKTMGCDINDDTVNKEDTEGIQGQHKANGDGAKEVKSWLESIGFMKYYNVFIQNGFDSMDFIKEINDVKDLDGIGISSRTHQLTIVNQIKQLNSN